MEKGILLLIVIALFSCHIHEPKKQSENQKTNWDLEYISSFEKITIKEGKITWIRHSFHYDDERAVKATPDSISSQKIQNSVKVNKSKLNELYELIESNDFQSLSPEYGAPQNERHYLYSIKVKNGNKEKMVLFRSNPSYEEAPPGF